MRIESVFSWNVVSGQYRGLWRELSERRTSAQLQGSTTPWPMAHAARLFAGHAGAPPSAGPWWLTEECSDPSILTDTMQTCFLQQLIPIHSLKRLAETLQDQHRQEEHGLETIDLEQLYQHCDIPADQWSRVTNVLEKLAIVTAARP